MTPKDMWKAAEFRAKTHSDEDTLCAFFILFCVGDEAMTTLAAFEENYTEELQPKKHLDRLVQEGFLIEEAGTYSVTDLGWLALMGFGCRGTPDAYRTDEETPPPADGEG